MPRDRTEFSTLFDAAATVLEAALKLSSIGKRPDEIGGPREDAFAEFLSGWVPESVGIANGYVVSTRREISRQADVLLYRRATCPKFVTDKKTDRRLIPIEEVYGTIEVKSTLGEDELSDAMEKCASVANLTNSGRYEPEELHVQATEVKSSASRTDNLEWTDYRVKMPRRRDIKDRPFAAVLAYKIGKDYTFDDITAALERSKSDIDCVAVLDTGVAILRDPATLKRYKSLKEGKALASYGGYDSDILKERLRHLRGRAERQYLVEPCTSKEALMFFYACLFEHLKKQTFYDYDPMDCLARWKSNDEETE
jgi:hypothetical protein